MPPEAIHRGNVSCAASSVTVLGPCTCRVESRLAGHTPVHSDAFVAFTTTRCGSSCATPSPQLGFPCFSRAQWMVQLSRCIPRPPQNPLDPSPPPTQARLFPALHRTRSLTGAGNVTPVTQQPGVSQTPVPEAFIAPVRPNGAAWRLRSCTCAFLGRCVTFGYGCGQSADPTVQSLLVSYTLINCHRRLFANTPVLQHILEITEQSYACKWNGVTAPSFRNSGEG